MSIFNDEPHFTDPLPAIKALWHSNDLPLQALENLTLTGDLPVLPSSFAVSFAATSSIAVAAAMAGVIAHQRTGNRLDITVDHLDASMECTGAFRVDGVSPAQFAPLSGLYQTNDGYVRMHANFDHHRDIILKSIGLACGPDTSRSAAEKEILTRSTAELDQAIQQAGGACAPLRTFDQWDRHPQSTALASLPLVDITKVGDSKPRKLPVITTKDLPLSGIKILDLTRILAGPVAGRTLAAYGADVMLINSPGLPNISAIAETSRGKLSTHIDLLTASGKKALHSLLAESHVFTQGYRPGALSVLGFSADEMISRYPGLVYTSLSAYGKNGPLASHRGFDSLVQTAVGFNDAEASAFGSNTPKAMPVQILDYASGFLMAYGTQVALYRQALEGGSYHVQVSLARTASWLRSMGQSHQYLSTVAPAPEQFLQHYESGFGELMAIRHAARFNGLSTNWSRPSMPPGSHPPIWPQADMP